MNKFFGSLLIVVGLFLSLVGLYSIIDALFYKNDEIGPTKYQIVEELLTKYQDKDFAKLYKKEISERQFIINFQFDTLIDLCDKEKMSTVLPNSPVKYKGWPDVVAGEFVKTVLSLLLGFAALGGGFVLFVDH